eukprot:TRINITY_DN4539_c0_g2_i4.p4 TRINITY_DN4539_c0_g2~~TRINITY_DN4539_c0_g2_i4.p4  ORF type:complete len:160 (-),score=5.73 TRINITY_DN4539_c0_g2_i4:671-1150(-)
MQRCLILQPILFYVFYFVFCGYTQVSFLVSLKDTKKKQFAESSLLKSKYLSFLQIDLVLLFLYGGFIYITFILIKNQIVGGTKNKHDGVIIYVVLQRIFLIFQLDLLLRLFFLNNLSSNKEELRQMMYFWGMFLVHVRLVVFTALYKSDLVAISGEIST